MVSVYTDNINSICLYRYLNDTYLYRQLLEKGLPFLSYESATYGKREVVQGTFLIYLI